MKTTSIRKWIEQRHTALPPTALHLHSHAKLSPDLIRITEQKSANVQISL